MESAIGVRLSEHHCFAYNTLSLIFPLLDVPDILRCSEVCKLWEVIAKDSTFWRSVTIKDCKLNLGRMTNILEDLNTVHLKLINCQFVTTNCNIFTGMKKMSSLKILELSECASKLIEVIAEENPHLEVIRAHIICGLSDLKMDLSFTSKMTNLYELKLYCNRALDNVGQLLANLGNLKHLYLLGVKDLDFQNFRSWQLPKNSTLESLALGDCNCLPQNFVHFLKSFTALKHLRLEHCAEWDANPTLMGLSEIDSLVCLELLEFQIPQSFHPGLKCCTNLTKLTIVPNPHRFNMDIFNTSIMHGVKELKSTLKTFTWGFSERYLNHCRKVLDLKDSVPIVNYGQVNSPRWTFVKMADLENHMNKMMPNTQITITKWLSTGNVFT